MSQNNTPQPVRIVRETSNISSDNEVREKLVAASEAFADLLRSTYGPKGLDKMLYKSNGESAVTNDGAKIVAELLVKHPAAKAFVNLGEAQENAIGDGVTGCLLFAGALMHEASGLFRKGVHPLIIVDGFLKSIDLVSQKINEQVVEITDLDSMKVVAKTAMTGKISEDQSDLFSELVVTSLNKTSRMEDDLFICTSENVVMDKSTSNSFAESHIVDGVIFKQRVISNKLRKDFADLRIATLSCPLKMQKTVRDIEVEIESPQQLMAFVDNENKQMNDIADNLLKLNANCIFSSEEIDDSIIHILAEKDVFIMGNLDNKVLENISFAAGSKICGKLAELSNDDLGFGGTLKVISVPVDDGFQDKIILDKCINPKVVTIVIGGTNNLGVDEVVRAMHDALKVVSLVMQNNEVVRGGGNFYQIAAQYIRKEATKISGRERLAMEGYARALETIPATLSANSGKSSLDNLLKLRSLISENDKVGILPNGDVGEIVEVWDSAEGVLHGIKGATETAIGLLRVDQMISARGD